jgi:hypothetical protein
MLEYDLTSMAGEVLRVVNKKSFRALIPRQRKRVDDIISKYAKRSLNIVYDYV